MVFYFLFSPGFFIFFLHIFYLLPPSLFVLILVLLLISPLYFPPIPLDFSVCSPSLSPYLSTSLFALLQYTTARAPAHSSAARPYNGNHKSGSSSSTPIKRCPPPSPARPHLPPHPRQRLRTLLPGHVLRLPSSHAFEPPPGRISLLAAGKCSLLRSAFVFPRKISDVLVSQCS